MKSAVPERSAFAERLRLRFFEERERFFSGSCGVYEDRGVLLSTQARIHVDALLRLPPTKGLDERSRAVRSSKAAAEPDSGTVPRVEPGCGLVEMAAQHVVEKHVELGA